MGDYFRVCRELNEAKSTIARLERELAEARRDCIEAQRQATAFYDQIGELKTELGGATIDVENRDRQIAELREAVIAAREVAFRCSAIRTQIETALANTEPRNETGGGWDRDMYDTWDPAPQEGEIAETPIVYCPDCGKQESIVRPGKTECYNENCPAPQEGE